LWVDVANRLERLNQPLFAPCLPFVGHDFCQQPPTGDLNNQEDRHPNKEFWPLVVVQKRGSCPGYYQHRNGDQNPADCSRANKHSQLMEPSLGADFKQFYNSEMKLGDEGITTIAEQKSASDGRFHSSAFHQNGFKFPQSAK